MAKVSVIVPVYGVEKYLRKCLDSLLNQTLKDIEIILIDDGGKDSCPLIIDEYAKIDSRVIAIHKENGGYGHTCNLGLSKTTGEYVAILEPDDYIEPNMYEDLYDIAKKFDSDVVKSCFNDFLDLPNETKITKVFFDNDKIPQNRSFKIEECPIFLYYHPSIWSCIYKKEFLENNNIKFVEAPGAGWTDNLFQVQTMCLAEKINYTPQAYYYWRRTNEEFVEAIKDYRIPLKRSLEIHQWLEENNISNNQVLLNLWHRELNYIFDILSLEKIADKKLCYELIKRICNKMNHDLMRKSKLFKPRELRFFKYCKNNPNLARIITRTKALNKKYLNIKRIIKLIKGKTMTEDKILKNSEKDFCKILIAYHKKSEIIKSDILTPIHVGRQCSVNNPDYNWLESNMIGDNTGDNISVKNPNYCELTALYWAWKNLHVDYVGLMHYRRIFDFEGKLDITHEYNDKILNKIGLSDNKISKICSKYDVILPPVYSTHPCGLPEQLMTNYDFYCKEHRKKDLDTVVNIITECFPDYVIDMNEYLNSKQSFFFNMFIMKKELFNEYMNFLFTIMREIEKNINISENVYQSRVFGFLSERIQNIFIYHLKRTRPDIKIYYTPGVTYYAPSCRPVEFKRKNLTLGKMAYLNSHKDIGNQEINIVFSIDDNYTKHCAAAITSILLNSYKGNKFNIFILDGGISEKIKKKFEKLKKIRDFNLNYIKIDNNYFKDLPLNRSYISIATYYRLLLPEVLPECVEKVIYLDSDIIVEKDIAELWSYDISDKYAAVVEDEGSLYQIQRMKLPVANSYFNAGICVFNIKKLREVKFQKMWKEYYTQNQAIITLQDQDILNGVFNGNCLFVPLQWNTNGRLYTKHNLLEHQYSYKEATFAAHNPGIIHYTDVNKPWNIKCTHPLIFEYFKYLFMTPWKKDAFVYFSKYVLYKPYSFLKRKRSKIISIRLNKNEKTITLFGKYWKLK